MCRTWNGGGRRCITKFPKKGIGTCRCIVEMDGIRGASYHRYSRETIDWHCINGIPLGDMNRLNTADAGIGDGKVHKEISYCIIDVSGVLGGIRMPITKDRKSTRLNS